jgi:muconolactone delta-isomerase
VKLAIDRARLESARSHELVERAEANALRHVDQGQVLGIWRQPHGNGAYICWHSADPAELHHELDTLPLKPYLRGVGVEPMLPLRGMEDLAGWIP